MVELCPNTTFGELKEPWPSRLRGLKRPRAFIDAISSSVRICLLLSAAALLSVIVLAWSGRTFERIPVYNDHGPPIVEPSTSFRKPQGCQQRGTCLLHTWTDEELFKMAIAAEETRRRAILNSASANALGGLKTSATSCTRGNVVGETLSRECGLKIAFLFLARGALPLGPLWNKYFEGHEGLYNVYVHLDPMDLNAISKSDGVFWGRVVPSEKSERGSPGLIGAARRLMANAILEDPKNEWFAFISDSCIPVRGFNYAYQSISATEKSLIGWTDHDSNIKIRWQGRGEDVMLPEIPFSDFRVSSQFFTLRKKHAMLAVNDTLYWSKFKYPCLQKYRWNCFPEEHYFATLLNKLANDGAAMYTPTFIDWTPTKSCPRTPGLGHPREFCAEEINEDFIRELQTRDGGIFLFARKFFPNTISNLLNISSTILEL